MGRQTQGGFCCASLQMDIIEMVGSVSITYSVAWISELNCLKPRWAEATEKIRPSSLRSSYVMVWGE